MYDFISDHQIPKEIYKHARPLTMALQKDIKNFILYSEQKKPVIYGTKILNAKVSLCLNHQL